MYLPETVESIESKPAGVEVTAGDYFKPETLPTSDVILLEHIAHMYPDESKCVELPRIGCIDVSKDCCKKAFMSDVCEYDVVWSRSMDYG